MHIIRLQTLRASQPAVARFQQLSQLQQALSLATMDSIFAHQNEALEKVLLAQAVDKLALKSAFFFLHCQLFSGKVSQAVCGLERVSQPSAYLLSDLQVGHCDAQVVKVSCAFVQSEVQASTCLDGVKLPLVVTQSLKFIHALLKKLKRHRVVDRTQRFGHAEQSGGAAVVVVVEGQRMSEKHHRLVVLTRPHYLLAQEMQNVCATKAVVNLFVHRSCFVQLRPCSLVQLG
jgi:hypothetical protein